MQVGIVLWEGATLHDARRWKTAGAIFDRIDGATTRRTAGAVGLQGTLIASCQVFPPKVDGSGTFWFVRPP